METESLRSQQWVYHLWSNYKSSCWPTTARLHLSSGCGRLCSSYSDTDPPPLLCRNTLTESWRQLLWQVKESSSLLWELALQRRGQSRDRAGFPLEPFRISLEVWPVRGKKDKESEEPSRDPPDLQRKPMKSMLCQAAVVVVVQMAGWKAARDVGGGWGEKRESWKMSVRCERLKVGQDVEEWSVSVWECTAPCVQSLFTSGTADGQQIWTNSG